MASDFKEMSAEFRDELISAVQSGEQVSGYTHDFYRYPARFSPIFARTAIELFTKPGDIVFDPFMGGATTLVEARTLGRRSIGADINKLSYFLAQTKTTILFKSDLQSVYDWAINIKDRLNLHNPPIRATDWILEGYQRNINGKSTWPTRKTLEFVLANISKLKRVSQRRFARCALLRTAQWALDCRSKIPKAAQFRNRFIENIVAMSKNALEFTRTAKKSDRLYNSNNSFRTICLNRSAIDIEKEPIFKDSQKPRLILTSPPYPGVHVLYHRWQIMGRKETPAPFWIVNAEDGCGASFYTMGDRKQIGNKRYFEDILKSFKSISKLCDNNTTVIQLVGFSQPDWQLPKYLELMEEAGLSEIRYPSIANMPDERLWRSVPNRKWYADHKGSTGSSKEVVLFHELRS